jgi:hypothetical protein
MSSQPKRDDRLTVAAIAIVAFVIADVAHEVLGHGVGFFLAGGRSGIFTTTRLIETQRLGERGGAIFDLGGPFGNLLFAALPWLAQRLLRRPAPRLRLLLWLVMTFSLYWAFGYLAFCGVVARADWFALIKGLPHLWLWRVLFIAAGLALYRASMQLAASELRWLGHPRSGLGRLVFTSYLAAGCIGCAGCILDPRGAWEILNSGALTTFAAMIGLLQVPRLSTAFGDTDIDRSDAWIVSATVIAAFYIGMLGPGIRFAL